jgi:hypothetical protein
VPLGRTVALAGGAGTSIIHSPCSVLDRFNLRSYNVPVPSWRLLRVRFKVVSMNLNVPNTWLFIVAGLLAILGMVEHLWLAIPGLSSEAAAWLMFCGWFLLAIATVVPRQGNPTA